MKPDLGIDHLQPEETVEEISAEMQAELDRRTELALKGHSRLLTPEESSEMIRQHLEARRNQIRRNNTAGSR